MTMTINGSGTITGLTPGGLPDASVTQPDLAAGVAGNGPAFSAYRTGAAQSISAATWTKCQLPSEDFDTANCFDSTTNYRFTPNIAGYYQVNVNLEFNNAAATHYVSVYKNGSAYKGMTLTGGTGGTTGTMACLIYLNGSTDYIELYGQSSVSDSFYSSYTGFSASLARAA